MKQFSIQLGILAGILAVLIFCWNSFMSTDFQVQALWPILLFLTVITFLLRYFLTTGNKTPQQFVRHYMASTFIKMFLYLIILALFAYFNRAEAAKIILSFLALYFVFTIFEVISITKYLKK